MTSKSKDLKQPNTAAATKGNLRSKIMTRQILALNSKEIYCYRYVYASIIGGGKVELRRKL